MKRLLAPLILALLAWLCAGCSTTVYENGQPVLRTYADASDFEFASGRTSLRASRLNHSTPTRAAGSVVGTAGTAATGIITSAIIR